MAWGSVHSRIQDPPVAMRRCSVIITAQNGVCYLLFSVCKKIYNLWYTHPGQLQQCAIRVAQVQCDQDGTDEYACEYVGQVHVKYIC